MTDLERDAKLADRLASLATEFAKRAERYTSLRDREKELIRELAQVQREINDRSAEATRCLVKRQPTKQAKPQ